MTLQRSGLMRILRASIAPFLLLITPFASYLQYNRLGVTNPEVILAVLVMAAVALLLGALSVLSPVVTVVTLAALLTFFIDIQAREPGLKRLGLAFIALSVVLWLLRRHAARIVSLMMATVLAVSFVPSRSQAASPDKLPIGGRAPAARTDLPLVVHVILDEYIGPEGVPIDLAPEGFKQQYQAFYVDRGFRLFGKAYSEYPKTMWSIPELLNLSPTHFSPGLMTAGSSDNNYHLARNDYFERMASLGYTVRVQLKNPSEALALQVRLAVEAGDPGVEVLPVLWEDNYVSLMPGEEREVEARFIGKHAIGLHPTLKVTGWNIEPASVGLAETAKATPKKR